jgi:hypothetical protein
MAGKYCAHILVSINPGQAIMRQAMQVLSGNKVMAALSQAIFTQA